MEVPEGNDGTNGVAGPKAKALGVLATYQVCTTLKLYVEENHCVTFI